MQRTLLIISGWPRMVENLGHPNFEELQAPALDLQGTAVQKHWGRKQIPSLLLRISMYGWEKHKLETFLG